jgi:hypothetical protein
LVKIILAGILDRQLLGQGSGMPLTGGGQFGAGIKQARGNHGQHQITLATTFGGNHGIETEFADGTQDGFHVAVGQGLLSTEQILGRDQSFVAQQAAQGFDFARGPIGEVGQSALAGSAALAPALAEEDGGGRVAIGDGFDVHGIYYT